MKGLVNIFVGFFISLVYYLQYIHICYIYCRKIYNNRSPIFSINIAKAIDGLSLLFIILSTFDSTLCLSSAAINIEKNYFIFVNCNRDSVSKCICCNRDIINLLYLV
jgi:NADH:ubiquinone oxidoreductase subunit 4 (subunit M)